MESGQELEKGTIVYTDGYPIVLPFVRHTWVCMNERNIIALDGWLGERYHIDGIFHREDGPAIICPRKPALIERDTHPFYPREHRYWYYKNQLAIVNDIVTKSVLSYELQEFVIRVRPDLINQISGLYPELREKYSYEFNLLKIEI
jgi:hypothetical protein